MKFILSVCVIFIAGINCDDKKWAWKNNARNSKASVQDEEASRRYEVLESDGLFIPNRPNRPIGSFVPNQRPGGIYGQGNQGGFVGGYGQGNLYPQEGNPGILTGPVPSWERDSPIKDFDRCKCTEKFNCNTPGFSYGHCDVGKQYCCYNSKKTPNKPINRPENGILVGPGGPVDYPLAGGGRPGFGRPPYDGISPGIYNRPFGYQQQRPIGYGAYAKSAKN